MPHLPLDNRDIRTGTVAVTAPSGSPPTSTVTGSGVGNLWLSASGIASLGANALIVVYPASGAPAFGFVDGFVFSGGNAVADQITVTWISPPAGALTGRPYRIVPYANAAAAFDARVLNLQRALSRGDTSEPLPLAAFDDGASATRFVIDVEGGQLVVRAGPRTSDWSTYPIVARIDNALSRSGGEISGAVNFLLNPSVAGFPMWSGNNFGKPQSAAGRGQLTSLVSAAGAAAVLPAGGQWAYSLKLFSASTGGHGGAKVAGVSAGGSTVGNAFAGSFWSGFVWRIE